MLKSAFLVAVLIFVGALPVQAQVGTPTMETVKKLPPPATPRVVRPASIPAPTREGEVRLVMDASTPSGPVSPMLPDLVVREIRREGPGAFGIRVANQGAQKAVAFNILLDVTLGSGTTPAKIVETPALEPGGEVWVTVFVEATTAVLTRMMAWADPTYLTAEFSRNPDGSLNPSRWSWKTIGARVNETDEKNNMLSVTPPPG